jgi:hypothetical protein
VIEKFGRDPKDFDVVQLARITEGCTGSEIQSVFFDAMFAAFEEDGEPTDLHIAQVLNGFVPLFKTMAEQIDGLRKWSKGRCRLATTQQQPESKLRKLAA